MAESQLSTEEQVQSIWHLGGLSAVQLGKRVWAEIDHDNVFSRASELAYNFLFAVFPLLLFLLGLLGIFASQAPALKQELISAFARVLPGDAYTLISKTLDEVVKSSGGGKMTLGIALGLWSAMGGTTTMMSLLNEAYHVRESRSWIKFRAIALGLTAATSALVIAALVIVLFGGHIVASIAQHVGLGNTALLAWRVLQWPAALSFMISAFSLIYFYGPDIKEQHWYWITPGSIVGVLLWLVSSFGFRIYLHFFNSYSKSYGSLGAVMILLIWFYVTGFAFMIGGVINAQIEHAAAKRGHPEAKAPGEKAA